MRFCEAFNLVIQNTLFKKRAGRIWTWTAPNQEFNAQLDYILASKNVKYVIDSEARNIRFNSDHRLVRCELRLSKEKLRKHITRNATNITKDNAAAYEQVLTKLLREDNTNDLISKIKKACKEIKVKEEKLKPNTLPIDIKKLITEREKIKRIKKKTKENKIELNIMSKLVRKKLREHNYQKKNKIIRDILDSTKSTKK